MVSRSLFAVAMLAAATAGTVMLTASSCSRRNVVSLAFVEVGEGDAAVPHGFICTVEGQPMATDALEAAEDAGFDAGTACVVTDLVWWIGGDVPDGCSAGQLVDFCLVHECKPYLRWTNPVNVPLEGSVAEKVQKALEDLRGVDTDYWDTPDLPLIVRVFATFEPCSNLVEVDSDGKTIIKPHDPDLLFGCANSCAVRLDDVRGELLLDLATMDPECGRSVRICASDKFVAGAPDTGADEPVE